MGEYANGPKDERIKLGTCEDLFYVSRADVLALIARGWTGDGCKLQSYLDERSFRLCLPSQHDIPGDIRTITDREPDYKHRYAIRVDAGLIDALRSEVDHLLMYHRVNGTNFMIPCPFGKQTDRIYKHSGLSYSIDFLAEGADGRAIFGCPYCSTKFNLCGNDRQAEVVAAFDSQWLQGPSRIGAEHGLALVKILRHGMKLEESVSA